MKYCITVITDCEYLPNDTQFTSTVLTSIIMIVGVKGLPLRLRVSTIFTYPLLRLCHTDGGHEELTRMTETGQSPGIKH